MSLPHSDAALGDLLTRLDAALSDLAGLPLTVLADAQVEALLRACTSLGDRLTHATGRVAHHADQRALGDRWGARHTAHWWARTSNLTRTEAGRRMHLAHALAEEVHAPVADALAEGRLRTEQAEVITRAVDDLPTDLPDPAIRAKARDHLLDLASDHDAKALRILGKRILEVLDPEVFETEEQKRLEAEETRAAARARITMTDDGHGTTYGRFQLPTLHGDLLRNTLHALADPRRHRPSQTDSSPDNPEETSPTAAACTGTNRTDIEDTTTTGTGTGTDTGTDHDTPVRRLHFTPERLGQALMELLETLPVDQLPTHAGSSVALTVTIDHDQLREDLGAASLSSGHRISAGEARRLACRAGIIPAVLGGRSEVLDLGRTRRLFTSSQFKALALRDGGCTTEGCGIPPDLCHAHHDTPWSRGGITDLANGRLLCPHHHRLIHHPRYTHRINADNTVSFHRRT